jgi:hypothetical protein
VNVPGLGEVSKDERLGWYYSKELPIGVLGSQLCRVVLSGYDEDGQKEDFHRAIANFLSADNSVLKAATRFVYQYCQQMNSDWSPEDPEYVHVSTPEEVWRHVQLGRKPLVRRRAYGDKAVYVSVECECDWEPEHGLQIVFKNGLVVNKVGPYDGHLTNSDAYDDEDLEHVVYKSA